MNIEQEHLFNVKLLVCQTLVWVQSDYEKKFKQWWPTIPPNFNKMTSDLSTQNIEHTKKDQGRLCWKSRSWIGTGTKMWQG